MNNTEKTISFASTKNIDIAHADRLTELEKKITHDETNDFLDRIQRHFDEAYIHLDVKQIKEQQHKQQGFKWKALLVTNRGRFHTEQIGFGVKHSLAQTFNALEEQINNKLKD